MQRERHPGARGLVRSGAVEHDLLLAREVERVGLEVLGDEAAARTRILYGGSVKSANIAGFMREPDVDGALVGGASLVVDEFAAIVRYQKHVGV